MDAEHPIISIWIPRCRAISYAPGEPTKSLDSLDISVLPPEGRQLSGRRSQAGLRHIAGKAEDTSPGGETSAYLQQDPWIGSSFGEGNAVDHCPIIRVAGHAPRCPDVAVHAPPHV